MSHPPGAPAGVIVVPCGNRAPPGGGPRVLRIAQRYHFLCPHDYAVLAVEGVAGAHSTRPGERRIRLGLCPSCGFKWWGPKIGELGVDKRALRAIAKEEEIGQREGAEAEADERARTEPHDCLTREHDPDEWCPDCFPVKRAA